MAIDRSRLDIIKDILIVAAPLGEAAIQEGVTDGGSKNYIRENTGLNCRQAVQYLFFLTDRKLLKKKDVIGNSLYKTTQKGLRFLQSYHELHRLITK